MTTATTNNGRTATAIHSRRWVEGLLSGSNRPESQNMMAASMVVLSDQSNPGARDAVPRCKKPESQ